MSSGDASQTAQHPELAVLTADEMRRVESAAFARGLPSFEAMRRAGQAVAELVAGRWLLGAVDRIIVLCGPGNNGGDGFIAATALRAAGYAVQVHSVALKTARSADANKAAAGWGDPVTPLSAKSLIDLGPRTVVVDALFGIGLTRPLAGDVLDAVEAVNRSGARVVAVDMPSGIDADNGAILGAAIRADMTVTFGWVKHGHLRLPAAARCGELVVADAGFTAVDLGAIDLACWRNTPALWRDAYPLPRAEDHKYRRGHVLIAGGATMTGAARLAARAARRVGLGMLTLAAPEAIWSIYAQDLVGAIVRPVAGNEATLALAGDAKVSALLVGSGLEPDRVTAELVCGAMALGRPMVIDGGGLTALARHGGLTGGRPDIVLTPHEGEFARLFPDLADGAPKLERARAAAARSGCTIVLKGADTVIAGPDGRAVLSELAPATLATAGSGDVLAGAVTGLLGLGLAPVPAAAMAVWLHAEAARGFGLGLIAEDLPERLPRALAAGLS
jgi:NAD(P)H-hydrate epimerase